MAENEKKASVSGRRRKTHIYDALKKTVGGNINTALEDRSYESVAKKIGISVSSVKSWACSTYLPTLDQLVLLSQVLNRKPQWFLDDHSFEGTKNATVTYAAAYQILRPLSVSGLIDADTVSDYFLRYLLVRCKGLDKRKNIPKDKLDAWNKKIMKDFAIPIMPPLEKDMYPMLEVYFGGIGEDETVVNVLNVVRDYYAGRNNEEIDSLYIKWQKEQHPGESLFYEDDDGDLVEVCDTIPSKKSQENT